MWLCIYFPSLYPISCRWKGTWRHYPFFPCAMFMISWGGIRIPSWELPCDGLWYRETTNSFDILEMQDQLYSFLQMAPQLHLAAHVTCHLTTAVIWSVQQQGPIAILLVFLFPPMQIFCSSCTTTPALDNMDLCLLQTQIPIIMRASISKSTNLIDRHGARRVLLLWSYEYQTVSLWQLMQEITLDYPRLM